MTTYEPTTSSLYALNNGKGYRSFTVFLCIFFSSLVELSHSQTKNGKVHSSASDIKKYALAARSVLNLDSLMVLVEGGTFEMGLPDTSTVEGASDRQPRHRVTVGSFYISKYEVTQALWIAVMDSNPSLHIMCYGCPVDNISWNDAQLFISKLNTMTKSHYRLPTEAEWEYAAEGGNKSQDYIYSGSNNINKVGWYYTLTGTHQIGLKLPNELGLYDMTGNISEWCYDWFGKYTANEQTNPVGPATGTLRVLRGGNWLVRDEGCTNTSRGALPPSFHDKSTGLRLIKDLP